MRHYAPEEYRAMGQQDRLEGKSPQWTKPDYVEGFGPVAMNPWRPACNGGGKRPWFLIRDSSEFPNHFTEYYNDKNDELIRYTMDGAYKKAKDLNAS